MASLSAAIARLATVSTSAARAAKRWIMLLLEHSADGGRSGSAATGRAVAQEFLDALAGVDFGGIDVAFAIQAHLMGPVEFARRAAAVPEATEFFQIASIQNVDRHVGVV